MTIIIIEGDISGSRIFHWQELAFLPGWTLLLNSTHVKYIFSIFTEFDKQVCIPESKLYCYTSLYAGITEEN